jgi:outer membrane protein TolC
MKKFLPILVVVSNFFCDGFAQTSFETYIPKQPYDELSTEEKLVWIAWNTRSEQKTLNSEIAVSNKNISLARWNWANELRASFNLNEYTIRDDFEPGEGFPFFPRYNLSLTLAIGDLVSNPAQIKIAQEQKVIAESQLINAQLDLRLEVLEAYKNYQLSIALYQIGTEQNEEAYTNFLVISEKFKSGDESLANYNAAQQLYTATRAELIKLETQVEISQLRLERYIGVPLEEVLDSED